MVGRLLCAGVMAFSIGSAPDGNRAQAQSRMTSVVDPYDVSPEYGAPTIAGVTFMPQVDPWSRGYGLTTGYRPVFSGARRPIGHEMIPTRADGNGYVYRPIFAPSPGYHITTGGALIVEFPARHPTRADAEFPTSAVEWHAPLPAMEFLEPPAPTLPPMSARPPLPREF